MKNLLNIAKNKFLEYKLIKEGIAPRIIDNKQNKDEIKFVADYKWPLFRQALLESLMQKYLHSFKNVNDKLNLSNMLFLFGPEGIGKSWFLKMNLRIFGEKKEINSIIMHWDMQSYQLINFDTFLAKFKQLFFTVMLDSQKQYSDLSSKLNEDIILRILLTRYDEKLIQIYIERNILWLLDSQDIIDLDQQGIDQIILIKEVFDKKKFKEIVINKMWKDYITSHQHLYDNNRLITTLNLCLNIIDKIEHFQRPENKHNQYYLTGLESTDFIYDVLNYLAGYHDIDNYQDRQEAQINDYFHPVIVLEGFDKLLQQKNLDPRINDLLDHFILRFFTDTYCRSSFPLIIESNDSLFFNKNIYQLMNRQEDEFAFIELYGWQDSEIDLVKHIYSDLQRYQLEEILGMHIGDWYKFTKDVVYDGNNSFEDCLEAKSGVLLKEKIIFYNKLNKLYTLHYVKEALDQGLLDFELLFVFESLLHRKIGNGFFVGSEYGQLILEKPILKALMSVNILYLRHFFSYLQISKRWYVHIIKDYVKTKKKQMTFAQRIQYIKYKKQYGFDIIDVSIKKTEDYQDHYDPKKGFSYEINPYHTELNLEYLKQYKPNPMTI